MKATLRNYVRQVLLTERVFGAQAFVYHASDVYPKTLIPALIDNKFKAGSGDMYGKGLYTVYAEDTYQPTFSGRYGKYVYKLKINMHGFVIFDKDVCTRVYGKPMSVNQQLIMLGEDDLANKYKDYENWNHIPGSSDEWGDMSSDLATMMATELSKVVKGIVFVGRQDGYVCVIYDPVGVVPVAWGRFDQTYLNKVDKELLKPALRRSATHEFEKDRWRTRIWKDEEGKLHRDGGPAMIYNNGTEIWYQHGKRHRINGPAVSIPLTQADPYDRNEYWLDGKQYGKWEWKTMIRRMSNDSV